MDKVKPFVTQGDPNHPGAQQGGQFVPGMLINNGPSKVDNPGTGTFHPSQQGMLGKAQPQGVSGQNQYGVPSPGIVMGEAPLASPVVHPIPAEAEGSHAGRMPEAITQEQLKEREVAAGIRMAPEDNQNLIQNNVQSEEDEDDE